MTIGEKIYTLRKSNGWSQEELADRIGVTRQAISRWEADSAKPEADKIIELCDLFQISADYLLRDMEPEAPPAAPAPAPAPSFTPVRFFGALLAGFGLVILAVLVVVGQVEGYQIYLDSVRYDGFVSYLFVNDLWGFLFLDLVAIAAGLLLLFPKPVKRLFQRLRSQN